MKKALHEFRSWRIASSESPVLDDVHHQYILLRSSILPRTASNAKLVTLLNIIGLIIVFILFALPLILPFFHKGYFPTHDGEWAVVRLADMYREIKDGQIPPRFSGNLNAGYGYPLFQFAYPMPYYLGLPFFVLHFGLVNSIKLLFLLSVPLSGLGMFYAARAIWKSDQAAVISGLLFMYFPYRLVDLYVRGSLGEAIASVIFPWILYLITKLSQKSSIIKMCLLAIAIASLVLSHNIMAVLFSIIVVIYLGYLFFIDKTKNLLQIVSGILLGGLLSAYFWVPALAEKKYILLSKVPIADRNLYYVTLKQLLFSPWGYGVPTASDQFTYQIGWGHVGIFILAVICIVLVVLKRKKIISLHLVFVVVSLFFILMMFPFSKPLWENLPLLQEINYPWTGLLPLGFLISLLGGFVYVQRPAFKVITIVLTILSIVAVAPYARPSVFVNRGDGFYFTNDATTTSSRELMPLWVKEFPTTRPDQKVEIMKGEGAAKIVYSTSARTEFIADMQTDGVVRLNTIYFPGWKWFENGKEIPLSYDNRRGVMEGRVSKGKHIINATFSETPIRQIADFVSLFSFGVLLVLLVYGLKPAIYSGKQKNT